MIFSLGLHTYCLILFAFSKVFNPILSVKDLYTQARNIHSYRKTPYYQTIHFVTLQQLHCIALLYFTTLYTLHYTAMHCIASHCITYKHRIALHCITLRYIALHCNTWHYIELHCIILHYITYYTIPYHAIPYLTQHNITSIHPYIGTRTCMQCIHCFNALHCIALRSITYIIDITVCL